MKIFCVGLSRTGTHSLNSALERLGYTSLHYPHPLKVMQLASKYDALTDTPVIPYMEELDKKYPGAKFIFTVRDEDDWIKSMELHYSLVQAKTKASQVNRQKVYGRLDYDEDAFREVYRNHYNRVINHFKDRPDKLLIMNIRMGDGYDKLCPFLGKSLLTEPFPNESVRRPLK